MVRQVRFNNFNFQNEPRERPKSKVDNNELKGVMEADISQGISKV